MAKVRARIAFILVVLYLSRKLANIVLGKFQRRRQTRKYVETGRMASKLLWFETEDLQERSCYLTLRK